MSPFWTESRTDADWREWGAGRIGLHTSAWGALDRPGPRLDAGIRPVGVRHSTKVRTHRRPDHGLM